MSRRRTLPVELRDDGGRNVPEGTREEEVADEEELAVGGERGDREALEGAGDPKREIEESLSRTYCVS